VKYSPANAVDSNWLHDEMHGVARLEDPTGVYENVAYERGFCKTWRPGLREATSLTTAWHEYVGYFDPRVLHTLAHAMKPNNRACLSSRGG